MRFSINQIGVTEMKWKQKYVCVRRSYVQSMRTAASVAYSKWCWTGGFPYILSFTSFMKTLNEVEIFMGTQSASILF